MRVTAAALKPSDRWMANGFHHVRSDNSKRRASRTTAAGTGSAGFSQVAGLDGVGRLIAAAGPYDLVVDYLWGPAAGSATSWSG